MGRGSRLGLAAALAAVALIAVGPAHAQVSTVTVPGAKAPGPAEYDRVYVTKVGPESASRVLILVPGYIGGAGNLTLIAQDLVSRVPDLQVWAVDRRSQAFEDTSLFSQAVAGAATADQAFDYYLRWFLDPGIQPHFQPLDPATVPFVTKWGLEVAIGDLRRVVKAARAGGREVVLGGHSLGASTALAYTAWDFKGRPGYRGIDGIVLIDGGLLGSFDAYNKKQAKEAIEEAKAEPFADLLDLGLPWAAGVFAEVGALYAKHDPTGPSAVQQFPLLPANLNPPVPVTNRGLLGFAFDADTSPQELRLIQVRAGQLAESGDPRDWQNGEVTPIERVADFLAQEPANGVEWYFPERLRIDVNGADALKRNKVAKFLDLRTFHASEVDVPLYAFQTSLTDGDVLTGARQFVKRSNVKRSEAVLVDRSSTTSHLDPLSAAPQTNDFLNTVVPFLLRAFG